jgi:uncharacterized protein (TIGR00369 family)
LYGIVAPRIAAGLRRGRRSGRNIAGLAKALALRFNELICNDFCAIPALVIDVNVNVNYSLPVWRAHLSRFEPRDPDFADRVRESFDRQGIMALIGAQLVRLEPGECEIQLPFKPELSQQHGYYHGGIIGTIADSAGGYAAFSLMPRDASVLTVEYKMNLLAPGDGELLIARGRVLKAGRTLVVAQVDAGVVKDGRETLCATLLQTLMTMHGRPDQ